jgi:membrane protease YdiL (CAAX protease family)
MHAGNPGMFESILPPLNLFLGGLIIGLIREKTGSLWIPIGFHWTWNLIEELFGFATSGFSAKEALFIIQFVPGKDLIHGGSSEWKAVSCLFSLYWRYVFI